MVTTDNIVRSDSESGPPQIHVYEIEKVEYLKKYQPYIKENSIFELRDIFQFNSIYEINIHQTISHSKSCTLKNKKSSTGFIH